MMSTKHHTAKDAKPLSETPATKAMEDEHPNGVAAPAGPTRETVPPATPASAEFAPTPEEIRALRAQAAKADEHWDRLLRARADLENYKKRAARERQDAARFANLSILEQLIPVLDSFDMAMAAVNQPEAANLESLKAGLAMVHGQLKAALAQAGLQEIDAAGQVFDPNLHEAVSHQESAEVAEGRVLQQLRRGYKLHERLIRPASVVVAKKPSV